MLDADIIDHLCDAFEAEWLRGDVPDMAAWLQQNVDSPSRDLLVEIARVDVEHRLKAVPGMDLAEYLRRFDLRPVDLQLPSLQSTTILPPASGVAIPGTSRRAKISDQIGRFRIQRELGRGGFGCVFLATDDVLKREVALKIPRALLDDAAKARFMREAEAAASLEHVGIVPVYEAGDFDGECYIASAFCSGQNLSQWLKAQSAVPYDHCAMIVRCLAEAMQHAHNRGVVHRDLKPGNVMLAPTDGKHGSDALPFVPRITDFGMAKLVQHRMEDTNSSVMLGTPCYMAPEQFEADYNGNLPFATDIYALGVILYETLTGQKPHDGKSIIEVMDAVRHGRICPPCQLRPSVPQDLETICLKCLSKNPGDRYESSGALAEDLSRFLRGEPIKARRSTFRDKLRSWFSSPSRTSEAGLLSILLGIGIPAWITLMILLVWAEGLDVSVGGELIPQATALFLLVLFPIAFGGYKTLNGDRRWMWFVLIQVIVGLCQVVPPLFGVNFVFAEMYARYPLGRIVAYSCLTLLFLVQFLQYAVILYFGRHASRAKFSA